MIDQERDAVAALQRGDSGGLDILVHLHQSRALGVAYAVVGDRQTAEDVVADAFLRVFERIGQFDALRPFAPWFYRIVANGALKALRKTQPSSLDTDGARTREQVDMSLGPEATAVFADTLKLLLGAVLSLPDKQRVVVVLRYYLDMDERTIAATMKCPLGTVKWRLHVAKKRLRECLQGNQEEWTTYALREKA